MGFSKMISVVSLAFGASVLTLACSAQTDNEEQAQASADEDLTAAQTKCQVDADCVAIEKPACCPNGTKIALNTSHEASYEKSHECKNPPTACPMNMVLDRRVAECKANKCVLVLPEDIACGGFTPNPHGCPDGFECEVTRPNIPDAPGACKPVPPKDCRTTGCGKGSTCQICWATYACVPNGAVC
jgi:hypothetical protein